jgi:glycosyltransferase involved in cell wall biosynthesis
MSADPLVTTVIATYSRAAFLRRAIRSALLQSPRVRVAVYDNASPDETPSVVGAMMEREPRITYERHATNIGASANYNYGLARVTTPYFSLLADDDVLLPGLYEEAVDALERHPGCTFFCARTVIDSRSAGVLLRRGAWPAGVYEPSTAIIERMITDHFINTAVVFRRSILESVGFFDHLGSDRNYIVLAAALHPFVVSERNGAVMTIHDRSFSGGGGTTDFGSGTFYSWGGRYVVESEEELTARLSERRMKPADLERLLRVLRRHTLEELLYICATVPTAGQWRSALVETRLAGASLEAPRFMRALVAALAAASSFRPVAVLLHAAASWAWRASARARARRWDSREVRSYLDRLEQD